MLQNPGQLVRDTIQNFDIQTDIDTLHNCDVTLSRAKEIKLQNVQKQRDIIAQLARQTEETSSEETELLEKEKQSIQQLNESIIAISKQISQLESDIASLQANVEMSRDTLAGLTLQVPQDTNDGRVLKLKLYKSLGLLLDMKKEQLVIVSGGKTDLLEYNSELYGDYFMTNYIWDRL